MENKGTILVVDDALVSLELMTEVLTAEGYQVLQANSGEQALAAVEAASPDLVLLDICLPGMDGFAVLRHLKASDRSAHIPVILISASTDIEKQVSGIMRGAIDFILKPFQKVELLVRVRTHLELARLHISLEQRAAELQLVNEALEFEIARREEVEKAEFKLLNIVDKSLNEIYVFDAVTLKFQYLNQGALQNIGYSIEDMPFLTPVDINPEYSQAAFQALVQPLVTGEQELLVFETTHRRKNGTVYPVEVHLQLNRQETERLFLAISIDITERRQTEAKLKLHEARLESLLRINQHPVTTIQELLDFALNEAITLTGSNLGYIYFYNETSKEFILNSWSSEVMQQCTVAEPQSVYQLEKTGIWGEAVRQGQPIMVNDFAAPHPLKKGMPEGHAPLHNFLTAPVFSDGHIVAVVGVANKREDYNDTDTLQLNLMMDAVWKIVHHKREEEALRASESYIKAVMDSLPLGIAVNSLDPDVNFAYMNDNFPRIYRTTREALTDANSFWENVYEDPDFRAEIRQRVMADCASGEQQRMRWLEVPITRKGAATAYVSAMNTPVPGMALMISTVWDVTERKLAEDARLRLEQQMLNTQKLESLGVLAGGIAHDFNNILMTVMGNASLALLRLSPDSPVVDNLKQIELAADRAANLAQQMLAYSGKGKFVIESIDLSHLVEEMAHMLEVSISKKAVLRYNFGKRLPTVEADATQLRQVIMNLVINASEAIGDRSGVIAITTGAIDCDRSYLNSVWLEKQLPVGLYTFLEVADTGCGMDQETIGRLFDPFFTTKFTGRGLGMAAVLGIVRGHKGAVKVYSEPGKGTTFKLLFPAAALPADSQSAGLVDADWQGSGKVLLVDDEETVRGVGKQMLLALGYEVLLAADGLEALAVFQANAGISHVILDLTMPHLGGEDTFRELRRLDSHARIIMSSGYNEQEVSQKFIGKGLIGFIQKPYTLAALREVLKKVGE